MLYGFWISMDHPELSVYEVTRLIHSYRGKVNFKHRSGRLLLLDTNLNEDIIKRITYRSALVKEAYKIHHYTNEPNLDEIISNDFISLLNQYPSIALRFHIYQPSRCLKMINYEYLVNYYADRLLKYYKGVVNLVNPSLRIVVIISRDIIALGYEIIGKHSKGFHIRAPSKKPIFTPFSLDPRLARLMINLSGAVEGETILDPFCGVGGIPVESSILGIGSICIELIYKWARGALINTDYFDKAKLYTEVICGDSIKKLINHIKYVVTDPPYGRITTVKGYTTALNLMNKFLEMLSVLDSLKTAVFMIPKNLKLDYERYGFRLAFKYEIPVHSKLTRVLVVLERI